jgi:hypothetical protein
MTLSDFDLRPHQFLEWESILSLREKRGVLDGLAILGNFGRAIN